MGSQMSTFSVTLRYFILIATYVAMCLKNKTFLCTTQKHFPYWKRCGESVSLLVHLVFFTVFLIYFLMTKLVYLTQKTTSFFLSHVFATVKSNLFLCLFFLVYIPIIVYHSYLFVNLIPKPVDRHSRLISDANLFNNNFNDLDFKFNVTVDSSMNS